MTKKKPPHELSFVQKMARIAQSGVGKKDIPSYHKPVGELMQLDERIRYMLGLVNQPSRTPGNMLFFVIYDIESNKVRTQVAKYLLRMGCFRVQRSVYLADIDSAKYQRIRSDLTEIQSYYENNDSILVVPISVDLLKSMRVIGKSIDVDIIMKTKNTLFF